MSYKSYYATINYVADKLYDRYLGGSMDIRPENTDLIRFIYSKRLDEIGYDIEKRLKLRLKREIK